MPANYMQGEDELRVLLERVAAGKLDSNLAGASPRDMEAAEQALLALQLPLDGAHLRALVKVIKRPGVHAERVQYIRAYIFRVACKVAAEIERGCSKRSQKFAGDFSNAARPIEGIKPEQRADLLTAKQDALSGAYEADVQLSDRFRILDFCGLDTDRKTAAQEAGLSASETELLELRAGGLTRQDYLDSFVDDADDEDLTRSAASTLWKRVTRKFPEVSKARMSDSPRRRLKALSRCPKNKTGPRGKATGECHKVRPPDPGRGAAA